ncbi:MULTISPECIES: DMT family transporter [Prauserella salsuginis group]|uniref:Small multidrug resistance pump n=2 Tax=Prauserella salsuginis group TaxID=2893672 RepID=A0A839XN37_9PSEU|nr:MULTISPECIES: multidrug efflux SMR transporter [Prauserella salsuginis group]MBB3662904.1 small multidrug resistance pump [Prauserella sediminis]MCR3720607.1 small multidrug resistance pump [Prauserella flava]MCR3734559.1 small multidrug resistance pump [Prauserella salsuginis]
MGAYLLIAGAIVAEVAGTVSLKLSEGFSRLLPSIAVLIGYGTAFVLLGQALKHGMPVGVAYAIWAAAGVALVAFIGAAFLGEPMNLTMAVGLALVIGGVVLLETGRAA